MLIINRVYFIIVVLLIFSCNMEIKEGYRILNSEEIIKLSEAKKGLLLEQLEYNDAIIEELNDQSYLVIPQGAFRGLNVYNKDLLDSMIVKKEFPEETNSGSFYELFKERIVCVGDNMVFFNDLFLEHTGLDFDYELSDGFLELLEAKFNSFSTSERDNIAPLFSILINESFRRAVKGDWIFDKQYSLNTFLIPSIIDKDGVRININKMVFDELSKKGKIDLKETLIHLVDSYVIQKVSVEDFNRKELYQSFRNDFKTKFKHYLSIASELK